MGCSLCIGAQLESVESRRHHARGRPDAVVAELNRLDRAVASD